MEKHRYRLVDKHKHWHGGKLYAAKDASAYSDAVSDELEITEEQADKIAHKLERVDGSDKPPPEVIEEEKKEEVETEVEEESPVETVDAAASEDANVSVETDASETPDEPGTGNPAEGSRGDEGLDAPDKSEDSPDSSPSLKLVHVSDGKYNVMRGDEPINDVLLSKEEARSLMENN